MSTSARLLDPVELATLGGMSVRARVIVEGAYAGMHHNPHAGSSIEFAEHKEYAPGDEIRHIDWKAVARTNRYTVKRYEDDTEMRTFLCVDASASMGYRGDGVSKLEYVSYLAAALGYLLAQQGDPAGLLLCDDGTRSYLPPRTRAGHVRDLLDTLDAADAAGRTHPARALAHLAEITERRSLIVFFSDLLDVGDEVDTRLRLLRTRGHDVVLFHVLDPHEVDLPFEDLSHFEGIEPEDARRLLADPRDLRAAFRRESAALRERWRLGCLESRVEYRFATTDTPPSAVLRDFIVARGRLHK